MARTVAELPGGARVTDFISLGVLSEKIPVERVDRVLRETDRETHRQRKLPMRVTVYYVIALALYMQVSYAEVLRCLLEGLAMAGLAGEVDPDGADVLDLPGTHEIGRRAAAAVV